MQRYILYALLCSLCVLSTSLSGQTPKRYDSADLLAAIQELQFLGSALYIAAHPDDENTRMIAYLDNVRHARTAYLSLTRGDGGQNLIGPEIRELLGLIRTQELLAARRIDRGEQFFSRANDFGYSKNPTETFTIWDSTDVLSDAVWVIRNFQPDIIINRFDHRTPGSTHGHHTASAMLSYEAFDLAGDPTAFPEQLQYVNTWQPTRLFFNTSWWFYGSREALEKAADTLDLYTIDVGTYLPLRGESISEIAARSRSQHRSQGFGSSGSRGREPEYLEFLKGEESPEKDDPFAGINTTWSRVEGGAPIGEMLRRIEADFDPKEPSASIPGLVEVYQMIEALPDGYWKRLKLEEARELIIASAGLFLEAVADRPIAAPDTDLGLSFEATNRAAVDIRLKEIQLLGEHLQLDWKADTQLAENERFTLSDTIQVSSRATPSQPYWLEERASLGMYQVSDPLLRGRAESADPLQAVFMLSFYNASKGEWAAIPAVRPLVFKRTDPVFGEVYRPFEFVPAAFVNLNQSSYLFSSDQPQTVRVTVKAEKADLTGSLTVEIPEGWQIEPAEAAIRIDQSEGEQTVDFQLFPPAGQSVGTIYPVLQSGSDSYRRAIVRIDYPHIPEQLVMTEESARVVRVSLEKRGDRIGYIMGAGDDIPVALRQIGYQVDLLEETDLDQLHNYDAVVMGIRAYNTIDRIGFYQPKLLEYVQNGGNLIVQYNTNRRLKLPMEEIGPYPLKISRDRVTDETAEVRLLVPNHPVLQGPNRITAADFEGWVQERGLYFPNEWSEEYTPILSSNDPGEPARNGGLLIAEYGRGHFVYTGYSWFRELPAGVPGAYRLFVNLLSLGIEETTATDSAGGPDR